MKTYDQDGISIHTLRVEGDPLLLMLALFLVPISIHTLRVEGDLWLGCFGNIL